MYTNLARTLICPVAATCLQRPASASCLSSAQHWQKSKSDYPETLRRKSSRGISKIRYLPYADFRIVESIRFKGAGARGNQQVRLTKKGPGCLQRDPAEFPKIFAADRKTGRIQFTKAQHICHQSRRQAGLQKLFHRREDATLAATSRAAEQQTVTDLWRPQHLLAVTVETTAQQSLDGVKGGK